MKRRTIAELECDNAELRKTCMRFRHGLETAIVEIERFQSEYLYTIASRYEDQAVTRILKELNGFMRPKP